jgi:phosphoglycolate phosphatase-like HAD superfamily hydrolase
LRADRHADDNRRMDERARRLGANEALFRHVNERIRDVGDRFGMEATEANFVCECADASCAELVALTLEEYESVRASPYRFFIVRGHDVPEIEDVVERHDRFDVVEKRAGDAAKVAAATDPRA